LYSYLFMDIVLLILWVGTWLIIPKKTILRKQMLWSSFILVPVGLTDYFFIPEYWHPKSIFSIAGISPEALLFCFGAGGLAAVCYELLFNLRIRKTTRKKRIIHWLLPIIIIFSGLTTSYLYHFNIMYDVLIALTIGTIYLLIIRSDLIKQLFIGGTIFSVIYILVFGLTLKIDPNFVNQWSLHNLSGRFILDIPVEEIYWAFLFGAIWAVVFEDIKDYKTVRAPEPELERVPIDRMC